MACSGVVVIHFHNVSSKRVVFWNVDVASVKDDSFFQVPVFQAFGKGTRATMQDSFKGSVNFRVVGLSTFDSLSNGSVAYGCGSCGADRKEF